MLLNAERLIKRMDEEGLDGVVAATLPNIHYFAGFWSVALTMFPYEGQCYALITRDQVSLPLVVSSTVELDQVLDGLPVKGTVNFGYFFREGPFGDIKLTPDEAQLKEMSMGAEPLAGPLEGLENALNELGLSDKKVAVDELGLRAGFLNAIKEKFPKAQFTNGSAMLRWVRKVKTAEEIRRLREAAKITERAMLAATGIAREGITEDELAREFERSIVSQGGRPQFTLIHFGRNGVALNRQPDRTTLRKGDTIWLDTGAIYQGYWADIARNFSLGEPSPRAKKIHAAMLAGEKAGIAKTQVGMTGAELFDITIKACRDAGHPEYRRHHVGHGIGSEVYESPKLNPTSLDIIEEGDVINIETPQYEFGLGAIMVEDPYVVSADGNHEILTTLGRELHILPI
jgi:Xaa-Pro aminopeptidase